MLLRRVRGHPNRCISVSVDRSAANASCGDLLEVASEYWEWPYIGFCEGSVQG